MLLPSLNWLMQLMQSLAPTIEVAMIPDLAAEKLTITTQSAMVVVNGTVHTLALASPQPDQSQSHDEAIINLGSEIGLDLSVR